MLPEAQIKSLIDYFIAHQQPNWSSITISVVAVVVSAIALLVTFLSFRTSREQLRTVLRHHVRTEWNGLMDACIKEGRFIDATFTNSYYARPPAEKITYEAFCYRAWSLVDFIIRRKMHEEKLYDAIISWIVAYHRTWLERNPFMFTDGGFWRVYDAMRLKPLMVLQHQGMPRLDSEAAAGRTDFVDWDEVSKDYRRLVLGPWDEVMMIPDRQRSGAPRNFLLDEVLKYQTGVGRELKILDFGCGPGNILDYLPQARIKLIFGLDDSQTALQIASDRATKLGISFVPLRGDMRHYVSTTDYDVVISTNSILPRDPRDIRRMFATIFKLLKDDGRVFFILPAFDACTTLIDYWKQHYKERYKDTKDHDAFVQRCVRAIEVAKRMDRDARLFADDGEHQQCFHTEQSIRDDLSACGFEIVGDIRRVEYPWDYAARHDYGYFPGKREIWDWYVEAKKPAAAASPAAASA
jgi:SAM-dependent methyltransferase